MGAKANSRRWWIVPALILGLSNAGCSLFRTVPTPPPDTNAAPPPAPELPQPTATDRFDMDPTTQIVGYVQRTVVSKDDTLSDIARRFDVGYQEMVLANPGVDPWLPGVGREVVVPTQFILPAAPHEGVVVNLAAMRIFFYPKHKKGEPPIVYTFPIGIGREGWKTREGTTTVVERTKDPIWVVPASVRAEHAKDGDKLPAQVPPGPDNPLGQYRLRLGWPTFLIHGTNKPYGVGMRVSHGCMHLYPEDIAAIFDLIPVGTKVTIVNQPYLFGWQGDTLYMQAYGLLEDDARDWNKNRERLLQPLMNPKTREEISGRDEWDRIAALAQSARAVPVPLTEGGTGVDAVVSHALLVKNVLPDGSNWDGKLELTIDDKTYHDLVGAQIGR